MGESSGMSAGDVLALTRGNNDIFGGGWSGIIGLLIIAGIFGGGMFGDNRNGYANEFLQRDVFNTNTNVSAQGNRNQVETLNAKYDNAINVLTQANLTQKEVLENRYQTALGFANMQAMNDRCCCELKTAIHEEGEATRALITANRIADLEKELNQAQGIIANTAQTQNILNSLGNYYPKVGVNPYYVYGVNGTTIA